MTVTQTELVTLEATTCAACGVTFAMPRHLLAARRQNRSAFYCPNGHCLSFKSSEADRLRNEVQQLQDRVDRERARVRHEADQREAAERSARAVRGHNTRLKNRIAAGACPRCHSRFPDLAQHMTEEHPNYATEATS